jgi:hypothetical protein
MTAPSPPVSLVVAGTDATALARLRSDGVDHRGNPIEPFVDETGGWTLRCCLRPSDPGDVLAIVAWDPFPWRSPFAEVGPIAVHASGCEAAAAAVRVPDHLATRPLVLRPYGDDGRLLYPLVRPVEGDGSVHAALDDLLANEHVALVAARNPLEGCLAFTARRA